MTRLHYRKKARAVQHSVGHSVAAWAIMRTQHVVPGPGKAQAHRMLFRKSRWTPEPLYLATLSVHLPGLLMDTTAMACHRSARGFRMTPVHGRPAGQLHISQKRKGHLPLMCAAGVTTLYKTLILYSLARKAVVCLDMTHGSYPLVLRSDNHAPHTHAGQLIVQWRACSKGRPLRN